MLWIFWTWDQTARGSVWSLAVFQQLTFKRFSPSTESFSFFKNTFIGASSLCSVIFTSAAQQSEWAVSIHASPSCGGSLPALAPSHPLGHHGALSWGPWVYSGFLWAVCFTQGSVCMSVLISVHLHSPVPPWVHLSFLSVCVSIPARASVLLKRR